MRTIGSAFLERARDSENNFLLLRLIAASLVVYGHSLGMGSRCADCFEFVAGWLHYRYSGDLGVHMFFAISGFLVFASFDRTHDLMTFFRARALRIFPGLIVCVVLSVVVLGPLMTTLPVREYVAAPRTLQYLLSNATLYQSVADLPGVFVNNTIPNIVNGPIWTLPIESRFYLYTALLGGFGLSLTRLGANAAVATLCLMTLYLPEFVPMVGADPTYHRLGAFFAAGALLYVNRNSVPLNAKLLALLLIFAILSYGGPTFDFTGGMVVAYAVFWVAFSPKIPLPSFVQDYSYGIYLYGWPIAQVIDHLRPQIGGYRLVAITLVFSWLAGAASWFLIERPCLQLKRKTRPEQSLVNFPLCAYRERVEGSDHVTSGAVSDDVRVP